MISFACSALLFLPGHVRMPLSLKVQDLPGHKLQEATIARREKRDAKTNTEA